MFDDLTHCIVNICGITRKAVEKQLIFALLFFLQKQVHFSYKNKFILIGGYGVS